MTQLQALLLGIVQGLTEFFPVSSSGHLKLAEHWLGLQKLDQYLAFDLTCHLGTLFAIFLVFRKDILTILKGDWKTIALVVLGTLPLFPLVLILKPIHSLFDMPQLLAASFLFTSVLLFAGERFGTGQGKPSWFSAVGIGLFQAVAIIPGVSRSGSTISAARLFGWERMEAARFSFLLAVPAILGGAVLEGYKLWKGEVVAAAMAPQAYLVGFVTSALFGWLTLKILMKLVYERRLSLFAWYCLAMAGLSFLTLTLG